MEYYIDSTPSKNRALTEALLFFMRELIPDDIYEELCVDVVVVRNHYYEGECVNEDMEDDFVSDIKTNPREFTIYLRNMPIHDMIVTLAHECVHVKQHALNELSRMRIVTDDGNFDMPVWKGMPWVPNKDEVFYYDSPWEIEAYGKQIGMVHRFTKYWEGLCDAEEAYT